MVIRASPDAMLHGADTDGYDTDGRAARSPHNSTGESVDGSPFTVMPNGTVSLQHVKNEVVFSSLKKPSNML